MPVKLNGTYYGTQDAANELGLTVGRIRQMIRADEMHAIQVSAHAWLIPEREIKRLTKTRKPPAKMA